MCLEGTTAHVHAASEHNGNASGGATGDVHDHDHHVDQDLQEHYAGLDRRSFLKRAAIAGAGAALVASMPLPVLARGPRPARKRFADLTHVFRAGSPVYTFANPTRETLVTIEANGFYAQRWTFAEHSGTHVDVPGHFVAGKRLADELRPDELVAPLVVIDISARAAENPDAEVTPADLVRFERGHGRIPNGALVAMYSGWETRIDSEAAYRNTGADGKYHFPGFGIDAAEWLLERRNISGIGVDTLSLDNGPSTSFAVHFAVLGADRYGVENLRNLATIPPRGTTAYVGLVPWEEGSGGPARVIANW